jgi:hypothetical protein
MLIVLFVVYSTEYGSGGQSHLHNHGNNILLSSYTNSSKAGAGSAALSLKNNRAHMLHLHSPYGFTGNGNRKASLHIANMKLNPTTRKIKASVQLMQLLGKVAGGMVFSRKCRAFFTWCDYAHVGSLFEEEPGEHVGANGDSSEQGPETDGAVPLSPGPVVNLSSQSVCKFEAQYLSNTITSKLRRLCDILGLHVANEGNAIRQQLLNAWHKLRTNKYTLVSDKNSVIPPSVRVVLKLNEKPLFTMFCNYVDRLNIPANKHELHKKKLMSVQQLWRMLKDWGVVPELCRKNRLLELAADCEESDAIKVLYAHYFGHC